MNVQFTEKFRSKREKELQNYFDQPIDLNCFTMRGERVPRHVLPDLIYENT